MLYHAREIYIMDFEFVEKDGSTALQVASYYKGNSAVVNVLIKHGANVDLQNKVSVFKLMVPLKSGWVCFGKFHSLRHTHLSNVYNDTHSHDRRMA